MSPVWLIIFIDELVNALYENCDHRIYVKQKISLMIVC